MVSDLVLNLGFDRVRELDDEAAAWLKLHGRAPVSAVLPEAGN